LAVHTAVAQAGTPQDDSRVVGKTYLGITSGLPVIRPKYADNFSEADNLGSEKHFRTINVQWIEQWGLFSRFGDSWNQ
jgi:hypothetical protein